MSAKKTTGNQMVIFGGSLLSAGIIFFIVPFGSKLVLFHFIPIDNPICGIGLILAGIFFIWAGLQ